jgi:hypothetical protein
MTHVVSEDRDVAERAFENAFTSDSFDMECRILWPDNSIHWISAKGRVYRNAAGHPVRMMGTVADITEHKRAEEALERSERDFRELAESMPQIVGPPADGRNIYFNSNGWTTPASLWKTATAKAGSRPSTPTTGSVRDAWKRATQYGDTI